MQQCAKTRVKKCKRAKNWKIDFADVCIFFFWTAPIFADFCQFCVPLLSLGVTLDTLKTKVFILIISHLYLQIVTSASESRFCIGK